MKARVVAPGQRTPMPSPMPARPLLNERFRPSPKESSSTIESVPQAIASTVRTMRLRLVGDVGPEQPQHEGELGAGESHESFSATTGSSSDARRAGK